MFAARVVNGGASDWPFVHLYLTRQRCLLIGFVYECSTQAYKLLSINLGPDTVLGAE